MDLIYELPKAADGFSEGYLRFIDLLKRLERLRLFQPAWTSMDNQLWAQEAAFRDAYVVWNKIDEPGRSNFFLGVLNSETDKIDEAVTDVQYSWGALQPHHTQFSVELLGPHPIHGTDISLFRETIATVIQWQRPQHVSMAWPGYRMDLQPLDRERRGIGWLGWVPFDLAPQDVPEAAICEPMQGGTFLASQRDFWFAAGPNIDKAAIARAQALELRLNSLGVLPTFDELRAGTWGQAER